MLIIVYYLSKIIIQQNNFNCNLTVFVVHFNFLEYTYIQKLYLIGYTLCLAHSLTSCSKAYQLITLLVIFLEA